MRESKRYEPERYRPAAHASYYQHYDEHTGRRWKSEETPRRSAAAEAGQSGRRERRMEVARRRAVEMADDERQKDRRARAHFSASAKSGSGRESQDKPAAKPRLRGGRDKSEDRRRQDAWREDRAWRSSRGRESESSPGRETGQKPARAAETKRRTTDVKPGQAKKPAKEKVGNDPTYFRILLPVALRVVKFAFADGKFPWG